MPETINIGPLQLRFLYSKDDTAGSIDMFEMTLQPNARMPIPHYHESWDETVYGLAGTTSWRVDGKDIDVGPGETIFIKRGIVHAFTNRTAASQSFSLTSWRSTGDGDSSTSFWWRRCIEQSRSQRWTALPWLSARICTSTWRPNSTYFSM